MIILEGFDNTGKTTLLQTLAAHFQLPTARANFFPEREEEILSWHHWTNAAPRTLILDRHPAISDLIYGPPLRGRTSSSQRLAEQCRGDHFLIYCRPPEQAIRRTYSDREQLEGTAERLVEMLHNYDELMYELIPNVYYDWTNPRATEIVITNLTQYLRKL